jgi:methanogenic corrinoid protein MtbC1
MQNVHFTPPQLARLFQVNVSTIKRWVDKGMLDSKLTAGGHRRVTQTQLAAFIDKYPQQARHSYVLKRYARTTELAPTTWQKYYRFLERNEVPQAEQIIEAIYIARTPIPRILDEVIVPALRHIGDAWAAGTISIFEEHRMSFIIRMQLLHLDQYIPAIESKRAPIVVLACAPGEHHEIPLQMLAIISKLQGWRAAMLGINVPIAEMEKAMVSLKAKLLCVTSTYTHKSSSKILKQLGIFCVKHKATLAIGGGGWPTSLRGHARTHRYFSNLVSFETFLGKLD